MGFRGCIWSGKPCHEGLVEGVYLITLKVLLARRLRNQHISGGVDIASNSEQIKVEYSYPVKMFYDI